MKNLLVIIPAVGEDSLARVLENIPQKLCGWRPHCRVYGRDFGSAPQRFPQVVFQERSGDAAGRGAVVRHGFADAIALDADAAVVLDGDGQCTHRAFPDFIRAFDAGLEYVIASRYHAPVAETPPLDRELLAFATTATLNQLTGWQLTDVGSGYIGISTRLARAVLPDLVTDGYGISLEILLRLHALGVPHPHEIANSINYRRGNGKFARLYSPECLPLRSERAAIYLRVMTETLQSLGTTGTCLHPRTSTHAKHKEEKTLFWEPQSSPSLHVQA